MAIAQIAALPFFDSGAPTAVANGSAIVSAGATAVASGSGVGEPTAVMAGASSPIIVSRIGSSDGGVSS